MIVRNLKDREVRETTYRAHGGGIAQMMLENLIERLSFTRQITAALSDRTACGQKDSACTTV